MRKAFTLIEMMVSISILSIMVLYLYQSYASLNRSNETIEKEMKSVKHIQKLNKVVFLDFSLGIHKSTKIINRDNNEDFVFLQSSNSLHQRFHQYIAYVVKDEKLYRLESLQAFQSYEISVDHHFDVDYLGEVESFRVYKSKSEKREVYLVDIDFKNQEDLILKINVLNQY